MLKECIKPSSRTAYVCALKEGSRQARLQHSPTSFVMIFPETAGQIIDADIIARRAMDELAVPDVNPNVVDVPIVIRIEEYKVANAKVGFLNPSSFFRLFFALARQIDLMPLLEYKLNE